MEQLFVHVEGGLSQLVDRSPEVQKASFVRLDEHRQRAGHLQAPSHRNPPGFGVIKKNAVGMEFLGKRNGFTLSHAEVKTGINKVRRLNPKPGGRRKNPRTDWFGSVLASQFGDNGGRNYDRSKENGQNVILLQKDEVIERGCV